MSEKQSKRRRELMRGIPQERRTEVRNGIRVIMENANTQLVKVRKAHREESNKLNQKFAEAELQIKRERDSERLALLNKFRAEFGDEATGILRKEVA